MYTADRNCLRISSLISISACSTPYHQLCSDRKQVVNRNYCGDLRVVERRNVDCRWTYSFLFQPLSTYNPHSLSSPRTPIISTVFLLDHSISKVFLTHSFTILILYKNTLFLLFHSQHLAVSRSLSRPGSHIRDLDELVTATNCQGVDKKRERGGFYNKELVIENKGVRNTCLRNTVISIEIHIKMRSYSYNK